MRNKKIKFLAMAIAAVTAAGTFSPALAYASPSTATPTTKKTINTSVATVAAHRAAETAPMILGLNLVTTGGVKDVMLDTYGSDLNDSPNQFLYNYRVAAAANEDGNGYADNSKTWPNYDTIRLIATAVSPMKVDLSDATINSGADIYLGNQTGSDGIDYDTKIGSNVTDLNYGCSNIEAMMTTMDNLAAAAVSLGKTTNLYGESPVTVANRYRKYVEGTESYIKGLISAGTIAEKTVAVMAQASDGRYILYTSTYTQGTSINRAAEYLDDTTKNIVETYATLGSDGSWTMKDGASDVLENNGNGSFTIKTGKEATVFAAVDAFVLTAFQGSNMSSLPTTYTYKTGYRVYDKLPESSYGIYMNSAENALGMVSMIMGVYEGTSGVTVTEEDAVAYYYKNFYHIKTAEIDTLANAHFAGVMNYSSITDGQESTYVNSYANMLATQ